MKKIDLILQPEWIIPIAPEITVLENHAIAVHNQKIIAIEPVDAVNQKYEAASVVKRRGHVAMPGLMNCHTHLAMNILRGLADDLAFDDWLQNHIWPAEGKNVSPTFVKEGTEMALAEMIRSGTTCFNDSYFYQEATAEAAIAAGVRGMIGLTVLDVPTNWAKNQEEYFNRNLQIYESFKKEDRIGFMWMPHSFYSVGEASFRRIQECNQDLNLGVHIHAQETAHEIEKVQMEQGMRPLAYMKSLGLLNEKFLAVHYTNSNEDDHALLKEANASVGHCPESNLKLATGFCDIAALRKYGVNVCLATDGAASNNDLDMLGEMRTASLLAKGQSRNPEMLSAFETLKMATRNGAKALGLLDRVGTLEVGKEADMITIDLSQIEQQPLYHPISQIVYSSTRDQVKDVWVQGKCLMENRELQTIDLDRVQANARAWKEKIV